MKSSKIQWVIVALIFSVSSITFGQKVANKVDSISYSAGLLFAKSLEQSGINEVDADMIAQAINDKMNDKSLAISEVDAETFYGKYINELKLEKGKMNKEAGEKFLAENAKKEGITVTPSGLQYEVLKSGEGKTPGPTDKVMAHYHGMLIDGRVFDSSVDRGQPLELPVNGVIEGWQEALQMMKEGDKWRLYLPYDLAYGTRGAGPLIGPYSALIFDVELLEVK